MDDPDSKGGGVWPIPFATASTTVIPGEYCMRSMRCEGRGPRWLNQTRSFHLGPLPLAQLTLRSAGDDNSSYFGAPEMPSDARRSAAFIILPSRITSST
jgi:hypothetical protein